jgi:uncharacterized protein YlxP (DUF503 family)
LDSKALVGVLVVRLFMRDNASLKDRRQIVRSILDRAKNSRNLSVAEIDSPKDCRMSTLAFACIGSQEHILQKMMEEQLENLYDDYRVEVTQAEIEIR